MQIKSKFKLLKSPLESGLLYMGPQLGQEVVEFFWNELGEDLKYYAANHLTFFLWSTLTMRVQAIIYKILLLCDSNKEEVLDRIGDILYSLMPANLVALMDDSRDDFIESLLYPHRKDSTIKKYREIFSWLNKRYVATKEFVTDDKASSINPKMISYLASDYSAKIVGEKYTRNLKNLSAAQYNPKNNQQALTLIFHARFQCYAFSARKVSFESVSALLQGIDSISTMFETLILSANGANIFANSYLQECLDQSTSVELVKTIRNAAFALAQSPQSLESDSNDYPIQRISAITRWFSPWMGIDLLVNDDRDKKDGSFITGRDFIGIFQSILYSTKQSVNLQERVLSVSKQEIDGFKESIADLFSKTELDADLIDIIFQENKSKIVDPDIYDILMYCIQDEISNIYKITIPEVPVPTEWLIKIPADEKFFTGSEKSMYPRWRQMTVNYLLGLESGHTVTALRSLLKNPIASEIDLALGFSSAKSTESGLLLKTFEYLDKIFKFKPHQTWFDSELYKTIQTVVSGITDKDEKKIAKFASTWKCDTFEEYMKIVSLFQQ
jgi:hypothetical protein